MLIPRRKYIDSLQALSNPLTLSIFSETEIDLHFKRTIVSKDINSLNSLLPNLLLKKRVAASLNTFQMSFDKIGRFNHIKESQFPTEKAWCLFSHQFISHAETIQSYVKIKDKVGRLIFLGDYVNANKLIDGWINEYGESLWALRVKAHVLVALGMLSEANEICQSAHKRCPSPLIRLIISRIQSITVSSDANYSLKSTILPHLREFEAADSRMLAALLAGIFCPYSMGWDSDISEALPSLQLLPLIDVYDFVCSIVYRAASNAGVNADVPGFPSEKYLVYLARITGDAHLFRATQQSAAGVECIHSEIGLKILINYEIGNYSNVINIYTENLKSIENPIAYINIVGKSYAHLKISPTFSSHSPVNTLVEAAAQIYSLAPNTSIAEDKISSLAVSLNHLGFSASVLLCAIKANLTKHRRASNSGTVIARLAQIDSNEYTPLVAQLGLQKHTTATSIPDEQIPTHRRIRRKIATMIANKETNQNIAAQMERLSEKECLTKDYIETYSEYCISTDSLDKLVDFAASFLCDNPVSSSCFPMSELVTCIEEKRLSSINAAIVAHSYVKEIDDSRDIVLNEAFEDYLDQQNVSRPSEILSSKASLTKAELIFFRDICQIGTLDCLPCFKSGDELNAERVAILDRLLELNCIDPSSRRRELEELIDKSIFDAAANTMDGAKIYVDDAAIKRRVIEDVSKLVTLFKAVPDDEPDVEDLLELQIDVEEIDDADSSPRRALIKNAKSATVLKMWLLVTNAFKDDEKYGLDKTLSAEVRHGFFSNLIRSKLEDRQLITERDENGNYLPNLALRQANPLVLPRILNAIDVSFGEFSFAFNKAVEKAESWMKIQGADPEADDGISFALTSLELNLLKQDVEIHTEPHRAVDLILAIAWSKVETALEEIRRRLNVVFRSEVEAAFEKLESDLMEAKEGLPLLKVMENITDAHASFIADLDSAVAWFYRASSNQLPASGIDYLINIAIRAFERVNALSSVAYIDIDQVSSFSIKRTATKPFCIALINIFDNCLMHSGFGRATKISVWGQIDKATNVVTLEISNTLSSKRAEALGPDYIAQINEKAKSRQSFSLLKSEGGSGTTKAYWEIVNSLSNADVSFLVQAGNFITRIKYET